MGILDFIAERFQAPVSDGEVTILIPTMFDSRLVAELCLRSIFKNTDYPYYSVIVCDAGADEEARLFLEEQQGAGKIRLINAKDWERPKDDLVAEVTTKYYLILHDDIRIRRRDWLSNRMRKMLSHPDNAIVGPVVPNYRTNGFRFLPLGLLAKTEVSRELDLKWGKQVEEGFDTGALAYRKFIAQSRYRYVQFKSSKDIEHFGAMTWPKYKDASLPETQKLLRERDVKLRRIRSMLATDRF